MTLISRLGAAAIAGLLAVPAATVVLPLPAYAQYNCPPEECPERALGWHARLTSAHAPSGVIRDDDVAEKRKKEAADQANCALHKDCADPPADAPDSEEGADPDEDEDGDIVLDTDTAD